MDSFGNRLKTFRKSTGLSQADFANKINTNQQNVSQWEKGEHVPYGDSIMNIQKSYPNLNMDWLINGTGNMIKGTITMIRPTGEMKVTKEREPEDPEIKELFRQIRTKEKVIEALIEQNDLLRKEIEVLRKEVESLTR